MHTSKDSIYVTRIWKKFANFFELNEPKKSWVLRGREGNGKRNRPDCAQAVQHSVRYSCRTDYSVVSVSGAHLSDYAVNDSYSVFPGFFPPRIINFTLLVSLRARGTADAASTWLNMVPVAGIGNWHHGLMACRTSIPVSSRASM